MRNDKDTNVPNKMEYISREAVMDYIRTESGGFLYIEMKAEDIVDGIDAIPAADVVEVVRCRDCINWDGNECITMYGMVCTLPNDYCSRGRSVINSVRNSDC